MHSRGVEVNSILHLKNSDLISLHPDKPGTSKLDSTPHDYPKQQNREVQVGDANAFDYDTDLWARRTHLEPLHMSHHDAASNMIAHPQAAAARRRYSGMLMPPTEDSTRIQFGDVEVHNFAAANVRRARIQVVPGYSQTPLASSQLQPIPAVGSQNYCGLNFERSREAALDFDTRTTRWVFEDMSG